MRSFSAALLRRLPRCALTGDAARWVPVLSSMTPTATPPLWVDRRNFFHRLRRSSDRDEGERTEATPKAPAAEEKALFDTSPPKLDPVASPDVVARLQGTVAHLERELLQAKAVIRQLVALVDRDRHKGELDKLGQSLEGGGGFFIAADNESLLRGLKTPGARIVLLENHAYVLDLFESIRIRGTNVSIIGNNATIVGSITAEKGARLDVSDVFFFAPNGQTGGPLLRLLPPGVEPRVSTSARPEAERPAGSPDGPGSNGRVLPILSATGNSCIHLSGCTLVNGRDGVYLGINSRLEMVRTSVRNCIRGVYEGVGCHANIAPDCDFSGNYYQLVLLGPDKESRLRSLILPAAAAATADADGAAAAAGGGDGVPAGPTAAAATGGPRFSSRSDAAHVCPPGFSCTRPVWLRDTRADVVLEQDPIQDLYSSCWKDGKPIVLDEKLSTASLSDPVY